MGSEGRRNVGRISHLAGLAAEEAVARHYAAQGYEVAALRWRGLAGEIDLILRDGAALVFVEVKKSRSFAQAAARLQPRQVQRVMAAAEEFAGQEPLGALTEMRFDVALLDGQGQVHILENALSL